MRLPVITGTIKRRLLINFRVEPEVIKQLLPPPFRPKLHGGFAIAGICLIRLEQMRPAGLPACLGFSSENAAHRMAIEWTNDAGQPREGVFVPRRDTGSRLNALAGGRLFPGEQHHAKFTIQDDGTTIDFAMQAYDHEAAVRVQGHTVDRLPASSCFGSLAESSAFFEAGCLGYSATRDKCRLDGMTLRTSHWRVDPFAVDSVDSSYFADRTIFPAGTVEFDHALVMRDIPHEWHKAPDAAVQPAMPLVSRA